MSPSKPFYLTTTLPYVNADPHIGFALEIVQADAIARYKKLMGHEVFFNTGTDEHGVKIYRVALQQDKDPQTYVDEYALKFRNLKEKLGLFEEIHFIRTTNPDHKAAAQEFWRRCLANGDIYKKNYQVKYCVGCELEKTDSELVDGKCPIHPNLEIEIIDEENYFFRFSKYQQPLLDFYNTHPDFVIPDFRFNEIKKFVESGLEDFSISRLKEKMPWGVPTPDDPEQVMYVWFDALINYVSTLGWPNDLEKFEKFWGTTDTPNAIQIAGKDNLRQQSAMWQAMLMSAGLPNSKHILIHGFITSGGQKMSKSLGNVINPLEIVDEYGVEALRYYLLRHIHPFEDSDFTYEKFREAYNADLANGLGNLVSRIMKMAAEHTDTTLDIPEKSIPDDFKAAMESFNVQKAVTVIWDHIARLNTRIQEEKPFILIKENKEKATQLIKELKIELYTIGRMLNPILPESSVQIKVLVKNNAMPDASLFPRKD